MTASAQAPARRAHCARRPYLSAQALAVAEVAYKKFNPSSNPDLSEGAAGPHTPPRQTASRGGPWPPAASLLVGVCRLRARHAATCLCHGCHGASDASRTRQRCAGAGAARHDSRPPIPPGPHHSNPPRRLVRVHRHAAAAQGAFFSARWARPPPRRGACVCRAASELRAADVNTPWGRHPQHCAPNRPPCRPPAPGVRTRALAPADEQGLQPGG
jgi:hypothetical protein